MQRQEVFDLIKKYNAGNASEYEKGLVETWYMQFKQRDLKELSYEEREVALDKIWDALPIHQTTIRKINTWYRVAAAAILLMVIGFGFFYANHADDRQQQQIIKKIALTTSPGGNKAILILSSGKQLVLSGTGNGQLTTEGNTAITKTGEGKLVYQSNSTALKESVKYNTMLTPPGGTYTLTLSDGTRVTLDAASSIRYPVDFTDRERRVEITGQAYFEVAHNKAKPFRVTANGQTVEVLGTHFNVDAYADENTTATTLLEGSVKITKAGNVAMLKPGQQSLIAQNANDITVKDADIETAVAWKDGVFTFKRAGLQTVMHQFARWYNVQVVYEGTVPQVAITGKVLRKENATHVLEILNKLGIKFSMNDKKIVIKQP